LQITVVDPSGAVIANATVTVTGAEAATKGQTLAPVPTNAQGVASLAGLPPGRYTVSAEFHRQLAPASLSGNEWGLFFSAPIPIFNRNQGEAERARQEARQATARIAALQSEITADLRSAWEQYTSTRELVETIEQQMLAQARDVRDTTAYSYRRGEASFVELIDAQRTFNDTMQGYNEARAEYARSLYTFDALTGGSHR